MEKHINVPNVVLKVRIRMADVIVTLKVMPAGAESDLEDIKRKVSLAISEFGGEVGKTEIEPVAFGLKALVIIFVMDENKGSTEGLERRIEDLEDVNSVTVTDVRRAIG